ncbi:hypothetical protein BJV78DRAFT_1127119 [Lactifluus subvellereus]|nr:hypothetical protein BJV78DRAFT_1127119 [Lactifluus subvellereus]
MQLTKKDVWVPPITAPQAGTTWTVGHKVTVSWDTSTRPAQVTNPTGTLLLGFLDPYGTGGENLDVGNPLAKGFPLSAGKVDFVVPDVVPKNNYIVALIGDSGNISPEFTITK